MSKLRIFLADDHAVIREGLKRLIEAEADLKVVGEAGDEKEAAARISALQPAVAVINGLESGLDTLGLTQVLRHRAPQVKIVVLTAREDKDRCRALLDAGAVGCLFKHTTADEFIQTIRAVSHGEIRIDPQAGFQVGGTPSAAPPETDGAERLSEREATVLRLIAQGYSNKEIAHKMDLSVKTIETYKTRSMEKLRLRSRVDIVRYAIRQGWLCDT